jgi:hypothetical protein
MKRENRDECENVGGGGSLFCRRMTRVLLHSSLGEQNALGRQHTSSFSDGLCFRQASKLAGQCRSGKDQTWDEGGTRLLREIR